MSENTPALETESQGQLPDARIYGRVADNAKGRRTEVGVRIRELRMVKRVEELGAKLNTAFFMRPRESYCF